MTRTRSILPAMVLPYSFQKRRDGLFTDLRRLDRTALRSRTMPSPDRCAAFASHKDYARSTTAFYRRQQCKTPWNRLCRAWQANPELPALFSAGVLPHAPP